MKKIFCFLILCLCVTIVHASCLGYIDDFRSDNLNESKAKQKADDKALQYKLCDKPCPEFTLTDTGGKLWTDQNIKGKVTMINIWHVYSEPCIKEIPQLNELTKKYAGVNFLSMTFNNSDQIEKVVTKNHPLFHQIPDAINFISKTGISYTPMSILIDKSGVIRYVIRGGDEKQFKLLNKRLKELSKEN